jgi:isoquinoline 1-oxidoreductase subunit alpha
VKLTRERDIPSATRTYNETPGLPSQVATGALIRGIMHGRFIIAGSCRYIGSFGRLGCRTVHAEKSLFSLTCGWAGLKLQIRSGFRNYDQRKLRRLFPLAFKLNVNGKVMAADVDPDTPLLWTLRDTLGVLGPKFGCGIGACGACTVHLNGEPIRSCATPVSEVGSAKITTIEGVSADPVGQKVQAAWIELDVAQCGYCQPGQIMSATALLKTNPRPTDEDIDAAMEGNLCRCATYNRIRAAIKKASGQEVKA